MRDLEKTHRLNMLYDLYNSLLTKKQQQYFNLYIIEDFSFREVAEKMQVSHNAAYEAINKIIKLLNYYEIKLKLLYKEEQRVLLYKEYEKNANFKIKVLINNLKKIDEGGK